MSEFRRKEAVASWCCTLGDGEENGDRESYMLSDTTSMVKNQEKDTNNASFITFHLRITKELFLRLPLTNGNFGLKKKKQLFA